MKHIYAGGQVAGVGTYWGLADGRLVDIKTEEPLPGTGRKSYLRIPGVLVIVLAPLIGLIYVIAMPFIGVVTIAYLLAYKLWVSLGAPFHRKGR